MLSEKLKKRFAKDNDISITVFNEPYFTERLELCGKKSLYELFEDMITTQFNGNEDAYLAYYSQVKDAAIDYIKRAGGTFEHLNNTDVTKLTYNSVPVSNKTNHPDRDIYKETLVGRWFVSIDMRKANFSSLVAYGKECGIPFIEDAQNDGQDYIRFMKMFTDNQLIIASKYIRQVIFGNCNPKRQIFYEKCLMVYLLNALEENNIIEDSDVFSMHNDEIILLGEKFEHNFDKLKTLFDFLDSFSMKNFPIKAEFFRLGRITGTKAYIKNIQSTNDYGVDNDVHEFKCLCPDEMPFVYRAYRKEPVTQNDMVVMHDGKLAMLLEKPEVSITYTPLIDGKSND